MYSAQVRTKGDGGGGRVIKKFRPFWRPLLGSSEPFANIIIIFSPRCFSVLIARRHRRQKSVLDFARKLYIPHSYSRSFPYKYTFFRVTTRAHNRRAIVVAAQLRKHKTPKRGWKKKASTATHYTSCNRTRDASLTNINKFIPYLGTFTLRKS